MCEETQKGPKTRRGDLMMQAPHVGKQKMNDIVSSQVKVSKEDYLWANIHGLV
jgi:hypothetical protein